MDELIRKLTIINNILSKGEKKEPLTDSEQAIKTRLMESSIAVSFYIIYCYTHECF